jgi:hypothetical protein
MNHTYGVIYLGIIPRPATPDFLPQYPRIVVDFIATL